MTNGTSTVDGSAAGGNSNDALRSRFLSTAFFSKGIVTDAAGEARAKLPLPDNLTRWRVMAAVADNGRDRFGSAEASLETSKPLQIEPALPRFLTRGDEVEATLMVHNRSPQAGTATVQLTVHGASLLGDSRARLELAAGAQAPVRFRVRATELGTAKFKASATLGAEHDGFAVSLPVQAGTLWQTNELELRQAQSAARCASSCPRARSRASAS
ncbi:MAG: alpha-2-macroglobulin family protein [Polyangiaceae bacterium]